MERHGRGDEEYPTRKTSRGRKAPSPSPLPTQMLAYFKASKRDQSHTLVVGVGGVRSSSTTAPAAESRKLAAGTGNGDFSRPPGIPRRVSRRKGRTGQCYVRLSNRLLTPRRGWRHQSKQRARRDQKVKKESKGLHFEILQRSTLSLGLNTALLHGCAVQLTKTAEKRERVRVSAVFLPKRKRRR